jgi:hypothetical protein
MSMSARIPTQYKSPFEIDARPLHEMSSPHAGLLATSRAFRSLGIPGLSPPISRLKQRQRGFDEAQYLESSSPAANGRRRLPRGYATAGGRYLPGTGLGFQAPQGGAVRSFLHRFHDAALELSRPQREVQKSFIMPSSAPVEGLQAVQAGVVRRIAQLYAEQQPPLRKATVDQDATIIESHKEAARAHYEGGRGYQPMVAIWAEADLVLADEFRDGNVPAHQEPLTCAKLAFAALPENIQERYFRGDSACHEKGLLGWLKHPDRAQEPGGRIGFAVSAKRSAELAAALAQIPDAQWQTYDGEADGTLRQWAEVDFVPGERGEKKDSQPLRYVGLRLLKPQGALFADGTDRHHHAVITNLEGAGDPGCCSGTARKPAPSSTCTMRSRTSWGAGTCPANILPSTPPGSSWRC